MGQYKRITRKKEKKLELLKDPSEKIQEWIEANTTKIVTAAGGLILAAAVIYGVLYYKKVSFIDAQARLYEAVARAQGAPERSPAERDEEAAALEALIAHGAPDSVTGQARLELASLLLAKKEYDAAIENYRSAARENKPGSLIHDMALAGEASALAMAGRYGEAASKYSALADTAVFYSKADALLSLAYAQAAEGNSGEAVATLDRLKNERPAFLPAEQVDGIIQRIERGDLSTLLKMAQAASAAAKEPAPGGGTVGHEDVHGAKE